MPPRGPYAKGVAKREEILSTALRIIAENGYSGATVRELADAVGLSSNGLLRYFGSKDALFTEILRRRDETSLARATADSAGTGSPEDLVSFVERNAEVPGLVQLYARLSNEAAEPDHYAHDYFQDRYARVRAMWADALRRMQAEGRLARDADPDALAVVASALVDGLQTQWMYDPGLDMAKHVEYLLACFVLPGAADD